MALKQRLAHCRHGLKWQQFFLPSTSPCSISMVDYTSSALPIVLHSQTPFFLLCGGGPHTKKMVWLHDYYARWCKITAKIYSSKLKPPISIYELRFKNFWSNNNPIYGRYLLYQPYMVHFPCSWIFIRSTKF